MKTFHQLYEKSISPNVAHKAGLTNHLPMALLALKELGANTEHCNAFTERYSRQLTEYQMNFENRISTENWKSHLGDSNYFDDYFSFFKSEYDQKGAECTLDLYLPKLAKSPLSAAFHSVIRLAYAIEHTMWQDVPYALTYWAATFVEIPAAENSKSKFNVKDFGYDFLEVFREKTPLVGPSITARAIKAIETDTFKEIFGHLSDTDGFSTSKEFGLNIMEETLDFTALHFITGTNATAIIHSYLKSDNDKESCESSLMPSLVATLLTMTRASRRTVELKNDVSDKDVREIGAKSFNDHVIKLCDVALKEFKSSRNLQYLRLAEAYSRQVKDS